MLDKPFFSIVTAALNNGNTIASNLESVRSQSLASLKHIVIDGGSTDDTLSYLKRYEGLYPLRWISEPDRGIADAINKGITLATGRYLLVLQADDALIDPSV